MCLKCELGLVGRRASVLMHEAEAVEENSEHSLNLSFVIAQRPPQQQRHRRPPSA
jgi:hypothetical protein